MLTDRGKTPDLALKSLPYLNRKIWGIKKKKLTIIGARTSQGKSALALQIAFDIASQNHNVVFLSLEMDCTDLIERLFCYQQRIDNFELLTGKFYKYVDNWKEFKTISDKTPLVMTDCIGKTWQEVEDLISGFQHKPELIIIDYIQNIKGSSMEMKGVIDEYLRNIREMAIRENFAIVICSQINRASQESLSKEPQLHQLKGTGFLEEHSDVIFLLHWPHKYDEEQDKNKFTMFVAKNRNGRTGYINLKYLPEYYCFEDEESCIKNQEEIEALNQELQYKD